MHKHHNNPLYTVIQLISIFSIYLRVRLLESAMFTATLNLITRVGLLSFFGHWKIGIVWLSIKAVLAETSSKMASTLNQKYSTLFCHKAQNFIDFGSSDIFQFLLAYGRNTYYGVTNDISDFRCQHFQRPYEILYWHITFLH